MYPVNPSLTRDQGGGGGGGGGSGGDRGSHEERFFGESFSPFGREKSEASPVITGGARDNAASTLVVERPTSN